MLDGKTQGPSDPRHCFFCDGFTGVGSQEQGGGQCTERGRM